MFNTWSRFDNRSFVGSYIPLSFPKTSKVERPQLLVKETGDELKEMSQTLSYEKLYLLFKKNTLILCRKLLKKYQNLLQA